MKCTSRLRRSSFSHSHRTPLAPHLVERSGKLRAPLQRIAALARLNLNEHAAKREAFGGCKALKSFSLGLNAKP